MVVSISIFEQHSISTHKGLLETDILPFVTFGNTLA